MQVIKQFGLATHVIFDGSSKAINAFTRIHHSFSKRGYGIQLPEAGHSTTMSVPWLGTVVVARSEKEKCSVRYINGPVRSGLVNILTRT